MNSGTNSSTISQTRSSNSTTRASSTNAEEGKRKVLNHLRSIVMSRFTFSMFGSFNAPQDNNPDKAAYRIALIGMEPMDFLTFNQKLSKSVEKEESDVSEIKQVIYR